jgi:hypothetical protein
MAIHSAIASAAPQGTGAIRQAGQSTGMSFEYLLTTAKIESNFQPRADFDIVGQRSLSIHRPDLAWHHEAGRGGAVDSQASAMLAGALTRNNSALVSGE